jgi:hypothetical protein
VIRRLTTRRGLANLLDALPAEVLMREHGGALGNRPSVRVRIKALDSLSRQLARKRSVRDDFPRGSGQTGSAMGELIGRQIQRIHQLAIARRQWPRPTHQHPVPPSLETLRRFAKADST